MAHQVAPAHPEPGRFCAWPQATLHNGGISDVIRGLTNMGLWGRCIAYRADVPQGRRPPPAHGAHGRARQPWRSTWTRWPESNGDVYHSIGVICGQGTGPNKGQVKTMDPAEHRYNWRDVDGVIAAAAEYNREHETPGTIDALIGLPPMEN